MEITRVSLCSIAVLFPNHGFPLDFQWGHLKCLILYSQEYNSSSNKMQCMKISELAQSCDHMAAEVTATLTSPNQITKYTTKFAFSTSLRGPAGVPGHISLLFKAHLHFVKGFIEKRSTSVLAATHLPDLHFNPLVIPGQGYTRQMDLTYNPNWTRFSQFCSYYDVKTTIDSLLRS